MAALFRFCLGCCSGFGFWFLVAVLFSAWRVQYFHAHLDLFEEKEQVFHFVVLCWKVLQGLVHRSAYQLPVCSFSFFNFRFQFLIHYFAGNRGQKSRADEAWMRIGNCLERWVIR